VDIAEDAENQLDKVTKEEVLVHANEARSILIFKHDFVQEA